MANATCAAEGDNTIMELKVCQDMVRGRTPRVPLALMARVAGCPQGRLASGRFLLCLARATLLDKAALNDGQLLRDLAWCRTHLRVIDAWLSPDRPCGEGSGEKSWLESYENVMMRFPTPVTF